MKNLIGMLAFTMVAVVSLPAFANAPQSVEECQKAHAGDHAKIQACIDGLKK